jgi:hypothetical protein
MTTESWTSNPASSGEVPHDEHIEDDSVCRDGHRDGVAATAQRMFYYPAQGQATS